MKPTLWKLRFKQAFLLLLLGTLSACSLVKTQSKEEALQKMTWEYGPDAIELVATAEPSLNWWGGQAHTLLISVVQLEDLGALEKYKTSAQALSELLLAETAPSGLLSLNRYFLAPGTQIKKKIARLDKSRYVAVFLGYQHLDPARSIRVYQIGAEFQRKGWVFRQYQAHPEPVQIQLHLGADGVMSSQQHVQPFSVSHPPRSGWVEDLTE